MAVVTDIWDHGMIQILRGLPEVFGAPRARCGEEIAGENRHGSVCRAGADHFILQLVAIVLRDQSIGKTLYVQAADRRPDRRRDPNADGACGGGRWSA